MRDSQQLVSGNGLEALIGRVESVPSSEGAPNWECVFPQTCLLGRLATLVQPYFGARMMEKSWYEYLSSVREGERRQGFLAGCHGVESKQTQRGKRGQHRSDGHSESAIFDIQSCYLKTDNTRTFTKSTM